MKEFKLEPGIMLYGFIIGCLVCALLLWATGSFAATGDDEPAEQYNCPPGAVCGRFPR